MDKMKLFFNQTLFCSLILVLGVIMVSGCATTPKPNEEIEAVFYPDPPAAPRIQFLRSFTSSDDLGAAASAFDDFLTGSAEQKYRLAKPYGVALHDGKIYVCDSQATLVVFDVKNNKFYRMEGAKGLGKVVQPINIALDSEGNKFVADPVRRQVMMYDKEDLYVKGFGYVGKWKPVDAVPLDGLLYVVDAEEREIKVFDIETGKIVQKFGRNNKPEENLGLPTGISIGPDKLLYISDSGRFQVVVYDRDGHQIRAIGRPGTNLGHFARPRGVSVDREGRIYAVDGAFENVQIFRNDGQLLLFFGGSGTMPGNLFLPADVFIDYDNIEYFKEYADPNFDIEYLVVVTSQFGKRLINVYGFGTEKGRTYPTEEELKEKAEQKLKEWLKDSK